MAIIDGRSHRRCRRTPTRPPGPGC
jgi:hypothetical protein